jgi:hypothetical protein
MTRLLNLPFALYGNVLARFGGDIGVITNAFGYVVVAEHLPVDRPVSAAELAVIETWLGDILDELFADLFCKR